MAALPPAYSVVGPSRAVHDVDEGLPHHEHVSTRHGTSLPCLHGCPPARRRPRTPPPYEQLRTRSPTRVASGDAAAGTRLPTVRALASDLGLAVNTVAKAYRALETDGVIVTEGRRGTFVAARAGRRRATAARRPEYVAVARRLGLGVAEAKALVERHW